MDTVANQHASRQDGISMRELIHTLWRVKWYIVIATVVVTAIVAALSIVLPKKYTATIVVAPVSSGSGDLGSTGVGSLLSQVGGLASLAGLSVPGGEEKSENVAILQSEGLVQRFIGANGLLPLIEDTDKKLDTLWKVDVFFRRKVMLVTTDPKTGLVSLSVTWGNPLIAAQWANGLVRTTNDYIRSKAIRETQRDIDYLNDEATKTAAIGIRQAIYSIMQEEIKKQMLAKGSDEYALKIIDQAIPPEKATSPRPLLWTAGAFAGCVGAWILGALCWLAWRDP